jgi:phosphatidate cytidylyltransferase
MIGLKQRIKTSLVLALILFPILIFGDVVLFAGISIFDVFGFVAAIIAAFEMTNLFQHERKLPLLVGTIAILSSGAFYTLVVLTSRGVVDTLYLLSFLILFLLVQSMILVFLDVYKAVDFGNQWTILFYSSLGFAALAVLRGFGLIPILYLVIVAMMTDTAAYFIGIRFGKHKLIPLVSPKKSVEGAVAGLIFGAGFAALFAILTHLFDATFDAFAWIIISLFLSVVSQIGDLVASKFKRSHGVKDFSNLFPGHGGVLDRFDSTMFAALFFYMIIQITQGLI